MKLYKLPQVGYKFIRKATKAMMSPWHLMDVMHDLQALSLQLSIPCLGPQYKTLHTVTWVDHKCKWLRNVVLKPRIELRGSVQAWPRNHKSMHWRKGRRFNKPYRSQMRWKSSNSPPFSQSIHLQADVKLNGHGRPSEELTPSKTLKC